MRTEMLNGWLLFTDESVETFATLFGYSIKCECSSDMTILQENPGMNKLVVHGTEREMNNFKKLCEFSEMELTDSNEVFIVYDINAKRIDESDSLESATEICKNLAKQWMRIRKGIYKMDVTNTVTNVMNEVVVRERSGEIVAAWVAERTS